MAKQVKEAKKFEFSKVGSILDNIAKSVPIVIEKEVKENNLYQQLLSIGRKLSAKLVG